MKKIDFNLSATQIEHHSLDDFDHVYLINNYIKNSRSSTLHPRVRAVLKSFMSQGYNIERNEQGRPYAISKTGISVGFSLSHCHDKLVLAVSKDQDIGIDIEFVKERPWRTRIAKRYFDCDELSLERFYQCFVAAEALLKASSLSLSESLRLVGCVKEEDWCLKEYKIEFGMINNNYMMGICRSLKNKRGLVYFST